MWTSWKWQKLNRHIHLPCVAFFSIIISSHLILYLCNLYTKSMASLFILYKLKFRYHIHMVSVLTSFVFRYFPFHRPTLLLLLQPLAPASYFCFWFWFCLCLCFCSQLKINKLLLCLRTIVLALALVLCFCCVNVYQRVE